MRWPWENRQDMAKTDNESVTAPAREEIQKSQERLRRVNSILEEARRAQELIRKQQLR